MIAPRLASPSDRVRTCAPVLQNGDVAIGDANGGYTIWRLARSVQMKIRLAVAAVLTCLTIFPFAQQSAGQTALLSAQEALAALDRSPRWEEWARIADGADVVNAWMVFPEREDNAPIVLVIHDVSGLTDPVRAAADQLAAAGFIAITPDLLSGKSSGGYGTAAIDSDETAAITRALSQDEVHRRLAAVVKHASGLKKRTSVRAGIKASAPLVPGASGQVGVVGFGWGADIALGFTAPQTEVKAVIAYSAASSSDVGAPTLRLNNGGWPQAIEFLKMHLEQ